MKHWFSPCHVERVYLSLHHPDIVVERANCHEAANNAEIIAALTQHDVCLGLVDSAEVAT